MKALEAISRCTFVPQFFERASTSCEHQSDVRRVLESTYREREKLHIRVPVTKSLLDADYRILRSILSVTVDLVAHIQIQLPVLCRQILVCGLCHELVHRVG